MGSHFTAMEWIDEQNKPTEELIGLVEAFGTASWREAINGMVRGTYAFVPEPWEDLTGETLREAFTTYTQRSESQMIAQAETFFLALVLECGVQLTERLYFRAERAHNLVGKRAKDEDGQENAPVRDKLSREKPAVFIASSGDDMEYLNAIMTLSKLFGQNGLSDHEMKAVGITLSVLGRYSKSNLTRKD